MVRNHLLCPYLDCFAHQRNETLRIRALVDEERNVVLQKSIAGKKAKSKLRFLYKLWVIPSKCPYCNRPVEVVIDETHNGRNISIRLPIGKKHVPEKAKDKSRRGVLTREEILELEGKYDEDYPWWTSTEKELGEKLRRTKELKKADLAQIVEWKFAALKGRKIRVLRLIAQNSETEIMRISKKAFALSSNSDSQRVDMLKSLTGIGPALASTILTFYDPEHYGIFDIHVWRELFGKGLANLFTTKNYLELLMELRGIANQHSLQVRTVEKALFKKNIDEAN